MSFVITENQYWNSILRVCDGAIGLLSTYENQELDLVDTALEALRNLRRHGPTIDAARGYQLEPVFKKKSKQASDLPVSLNPRPNWTVHDEYTTVALEKNKSMTCHIVTTMQQLEAMIPCLKSAQVVTIDCEFLAIKKHPPLLKVLQLAISDMEGYAVMFDHFTIDDESYVQFRDLIKPVLEDPALRYVGWAVRADAQAIEQAFPGICLPYILDLQEMTLRVAGQRMNLRDAILKYAPAWGGMSEFAVVKRMSDVFTFVEHDCIWMKQPLPPSALVYAVFDVTSLMALYDSVQHVELDDADFWPVTVTKNASPKTLDRWYQQRALNQVPFPSYHPKKAGGKSPARSTHRPSSMIHITKGGDSAGSSQAPTSHSLLKADDQFEKDTQEAILRSLACQPTANSESSASPAPTSSPASSAPTANDPVSSARNSVSATPKEKNKLVAPADEVYSLDSLLKDTDAHPQTTSSITADDPINRQFASDQDVGSASSGESNMTYSDTQHQEEKLEFAFAKDTVKDPRKRGLPPVELAPDSWGEPLIATSDSSVTTGDAPWDTHLQDSFSAPPAAAAGVSWLKYNEQQQQQTQQTPVTPTPPVSQARHFMSPSSSHSTSTAHHDRSPMMAKQQQMAANKWNPDWSQAYRHRSTGTMTNEAPSAVENGWRNFSEQAKQNWREMKDSNIVDYDKKIHNLRQQESPASANREASPRYSRPFPGSTSPVVVDKWTTEQDGWDVVNEPVNTMKLKLTGAPVRKTRGPKVTNVYDDFFDGDTEDEEDFEDGASNSSSTTSQIVHGSVPVVVKPSPTRPLDSIPGYRDDFYLHEGRLIYIYCMNSIEHVEAMDWSSTVDGLPMPERICVSISPFFCTLQNGDLDMCALCLLLNTGACFNIILNHDILGSPERLVKSKLGYLLQSTSVDRIGFRLDMALEGLEQKLGFSLGEFEKLERDLGTDDLNDIQQKFLADWEGLDQYVETKEEFNRAQKKKFMGSPWNQPTVPLACLIFASCQGAMFHALHRAVHKKQ
ncbi:hypothetical protein DM01DRAFT_1404396 [Hesseltinella vesiculosa]|uniref:3'-5' exonuclease domain-containing protein n=1 Tax=Hesseltinella vesiculosa TaxID=101127 RepID=A0A1X2GUB3_9FUNG|nr:hypothetical protein DM01DRAFT_1404396 [Hesseltinella vesiculosa]